MEDGDAKFDNYFWSSTSYEQSFTKMGFEKVNWHSMGIKDGNDKAFWQAWLDNCPIICFSTIKPLNA